VRIEMYIIDTHAGKAVLSGYRCLIFSSVENRNNIIIEWKFWVHNRTAYKTLMHENSCLVLPKMSNFQ